MRGRMITRYEIDGLSVAVRTVKVSYPRHYAVQIGDGPVLGYLWRPALGHVTDAYLGSTEPDAMGAHRLGSYESMHAATERIVREATARDIAPEATP